MAVNKQPRLKRCRTLQLSPGFIGLNNKESNRNPKGGQKKLSEYGVQLREKQKAKFIYGVLEKQFRNTFNKASKRKGIAGENLLIALEMRLDNVIYRLGFASSRRESRQLVAHGHFLVNGKRINIPSYEISVGDTITLKEKSKSSPKFKSIQEFEVGVPAWLSSDKENFVGKILAEPTRDQIDSPIEEHLIVELYSK